MLALQEENSYLREYLLDLEQNGTDDYQNSKPLVTTDKSSFHGVGDRQD